MDDDHFNALFDGDVLLGVSGGPSAPLEPVLLRTRAPRRDVFCWKRGETTASPAEIMDFNGITADGHERARQGPGLRSDTIVERLRLPRAPSPLGEGWDGDKWPRTPLHQLHSPPPNLPPARREECNRSSCLSTIPEINISWNRPMSTTKIIVLDDDPTGSQTVHSCLLLTRWDVATLQTGAAGSRAAVFRAHQHPWHGRRAGRDSDPRGLHQSQAGTERTRCGGPADQSSGGEPLRLHPARPLSGGDRRDRRAVGALRCPLPGAGLLRGGAHHPGQRPLPDGRRPRGAGARDRVRPGFGVRLPPQLSARLCGGEDPRPHPGRPRWSVSCWRMYAATPNNDCLP